MFQVKNNLNRENKLEELISRTPIESSMFSLDMIYLLIPDQGSGILWKLRKSLEQEVNDSNITSSTPSYHHPEIIKKFASTSTEMSYKQESSKHSNPLKMSYSNDINIQDVNDSYVSNIKSKKGSSKERSKKASSTKPKSKRKPIIPSNTFKYTEYAVNVSNLA